MSSHLLLQIVYPNGEVVRLPGGGNPPREGTLEADLIQTLTNEIVSRGVGLFRTSAHVEVDIREGIVKALQDFKDLTLKTMGG
jgi:hypothetical protein